QDASLNLKLQFKSLADFGPEGIVNQVPELRTMLELRAALTALKGPLGNIPAFRKKIQALLADDGARQKLIAELGLGS
ncbi:MAG: type VI secretion system contractile sheath small subunit, partial [Myxococcales bacterium]